MDTKKRSHVSNGNTTAVLACYAPVACVSVSHWDTRLRKDDFTNWIVYQKIFFADVALQCSNVELPSNDSDTGSKRLEKSKTVIKKTLLMAQYHTDVALATRCTTTLCCPSES